MDRILKKKYSKLLKAELKRIRDGYGIADPAGLKNLNRQYKKLLKSNLWETGKIITIDCGKIAEGTIEKLKAIQPPRVCGNCIYYSPTVGWDYGRCHICSGVYTISTARCDHWRLPCQQPKGSTVCIQCGLCGKDVGK